MGVLYCQWRGCQRKVLPFGNVEVDCAVFVLISNPTAGRDRGD